MTDNGFNSTVKHSDDKLIKTNNTKKKLDSARRSRIQQIKESTIKSSNVSSRSSEADLAPAESNASSSQPQLSKALAKVTESAPVLEPATADRKLKEVKSTADQLTSSSNSLKPIMRG